jgi:hypothetical protein
MNNYWLDIISGLVVLVRCLELVKWVYVSILIHLSVDI